MSHYQKFEIPNSWEWTTLGEIFSMQAGKNIQASKLKEYSDEAPYPCYGGNGIRGYLPKYSHEGLYPIVGRQGALCGNINMASGKFYATEHAVVVDYFANTEPMLWRYFLEFLNLNQYATATAQPGLSVAKIEEVPIPLPPIQEQTRIIKAVESWFERITLLEKDIVSLNECISTIKSKILELAMQGQLVTQDPNDEPAADMLRRVNPKAEIITDNPHSRNLPNSWCEVRIIDLFHKMKRKIPFGQKFKYIDIDSIDNKTNTAYPKEIEVTKAPSRASRHTKEGDIVFSMVRPYLRNIAKVPFEGCIASTGFYVFSPSCAINKEFAFQLLLSPMVVNGLNTFIKGDNSPSINKDNVENYVVPLPPLNEQLRICERLGELYQILDEIEASLQS